MVAVAVVVVVGEVLVVVSSDSCRGISGSCNGSDSGSGSGCYFAETGHSN